MTDKDIERLRKMAQESGVADEGSRDVEKHEEVRKSSSQSCYYQRDADNVSNIARASEFVPSL